MFLRVFPELFERRDVLPLFDSTPDSAAAAVSCDFAVSVVVTVLFSLSCGRV